jgi:hypothetical protein
MLVHFPAKILFVMFVFLVIIIIVLALIGGVFKVASDGPDTKYIDRDIE